MRTDIGTINEENGVINISWPKVIGRGYMRGLYLFCKARYRVFKGARNSKKSKNMIGYEIIEKIISDPLRNVLVVRQNDTDNRQTTFENIVGCIFDLGLESYFKTSTQYLSIVYLPTHQTIIFRGLNNPTSLNGLTFAVGYLTDVYIDEAYQVTNKEDFIKLDGSLRGKLPPGYSLQITFCLNAWNEDHWIYQTFFKGRLEDDYRLLDDPNTLYLDYYNPNYVGDYGMGLYLHISTYRINEFRDYPSYDISALNKRDKNTQDYRVQFLGMWGNATGATYPTFNPSRLVFPLEILFSDSTRDQEPLVLPASTPATPTPTTNPTAVASATPTQQPALPTQPPTKPTPSILSDANSEKDSFGNTLYFGKPATEAYTVLKEDPITKVRYGVGRNVRKSMPPLLAVKTVEGNTIGLSAATAQNDSGTTTPLVIDSPKNLKTFYSFAIGIDTGLSSGDGKLKTVHKDEVASERIRSATVMELCVITPPKENASLGIRENKVMVVDEYFHSNNENYNISNTDDRNDLNIVDLCYKCIETIFEWRKKYYQFIKERTIYVYVDSADKGFRQLLEYYSQRQGLTNVEFSLSDKKMSIQSRVDFENGLMAEGQLILSSNCKNLKREFKNSRKGDKGEPRENNDDHAINAFEYAYAPLRPDIEAWKSFKEH